MKADVPSIFRTCPLLSFSHQTAGRGNPCPYLQHQTRLKGTNRQRNWESCFTNPPTQSAATTKSPQRGAGSCTVHPQCDLLEQTPLEQFWVECLVQGYLSGGKDTGPSSALIFPPLQMYPAELASFWSHDASLMFRPPLNISFRSRGDSRLMLYLN